MMDLIWIQASPLVPRTITKQKPMNLVNTNCKRNIDKKQIKFNRQFLMAPTIIAYNNAQIGRCIIYFYSTTCVSFFCSCYLSLNVTGTWHQLTLHETSIFAIAPENWIVMDRKQIKKKTREKRTNTHTHTIQKCWKTKILEK